MARLLSAFRLLACGWAFATGAWAIEGEKLVPAEFRVIADRWGNRWDIMEGGNLGSGTNHAFQHYGTLWVNGNWFGYRNPRMTEDRLEYVFEDEYDELKMTRRVRVDPVRGVLRYLEIVESRSERPREVTISLSVYLGPSEAVSDLQGHTRPSRPHEGIDHTGYVAVGLDDRPSVFLLEGDPHAKAKLELKGLSPLPLRTYKFELPPGGTGVIVHYLAQRFGGTPASARELFAGYFRRGRLLDDQLPAAYRSTIQNFTVATPGQDEEAMAAPGRPALAALHEVAASHSLLRSERDKVLLGDGQRLTGQLAGGAWEVDTAFGARTVGLAEVAGLLGAQTSGAPPRLYLRNGEILVGKVRAGDLALHTADGKIRALDAGKINLLVTHFSDVDGAISPEAGAWWTSETGDRLAVRTDAPRLELTAPWGAVQIAPGEIVSVEKVDEPFPARRVTLSDGSRFTAQPSAAPWRPTTLGFGAIPSTTGNVRGWENLQPFAKLAPLKGAAGRVCDLIEGNTLAGEWEAPAVHLASAAGAITTVPTKQIARMTVEQTASGERGVTVTLQSGQVMRGVLTERTLALRQGDRRWQVPLAHLLYYGPPFGRLPEEETRPRNIVYLPD